MKTGVVLLMLAVAIAVPATLAPAASATHACADGFEVLCIHPEQLFCVAPLNKWFGFLCPY